MVSLAQQEDLEKAEARIKSLEMEIATLKNRVANIDKQLQKLASINRKYGPIDPYKPSTPWVEPYSPTWYPDTNPYDWKQTFPHDTIICDVSKLMKNEETT